MKSALLVGLGGIGVSVYLPELKKLGYVVDTVEPGTHFPATYTDVSQTDGGYDVGIICVPAFLHYDIALDVAPKCKTLFVEKPGVDGVNEWIDLVEEFPETHIVMVKNNLYRTSWNSLMDVYKTRPEDISHVEITWLNKNRIPNPGTWFTTREKSHGGVPQDLFPHLICLAYRLFGNDLFEADYTRHSVQKWRLSDVEDTAYGVVDKNGTYDVQDYAELFMRVNDEIPLTIKASWKEGYDQNKVIVYWKNGLSDEWDFGDLCPNDAYGNMIQTCIDEGAPYHFALDTYIHEVLEKY